MNHLGGLETTRTVLVQLPSGGEVLARVAERLRLGCVSALALSMCVSLQAHAAPPESGGNAAATGRTPGLLPRLEDLPPPSKPRPELEYVTQEDGRVMIKASSLERAVSWEVQNSELREPYLRQRRFYAMGIGLAAAGPPVLGGSALWVYLRGPCERGCGLSDQKRYQAVQFTLVGLAVASLVSGVVVTAIMVQRKREIAGIAQRRVLMHARQKMALDTRSLTLRF